MNPPDAPYLREWTCNGRVLCFRFRETSRTTADAWYADIADMFRSWNSDQPLLLLLDVRLQGGMISAQALIRARQVSNVRPDIPGRTAVLIASPVGAQIISTLIRTGLSVSPRRRLVFVDEARATQWLLEGS